jgi:hypothetical protein
MKIPKSIKEWSSSEELPRGFTNWLNDTVKEFQVKERKEFRQIGVDLGVNPSILSRWIVGKGPMNQQNIQILASKLGTVVYTFLGLPRPMSDEPLSENIIEVDLEPPSPLRQV